MHSKLVVIGLAVALGPGCYTDGNLPSSPGGFGANAGGLQDIGLAREMVKRGVVPPPEAFVVEGIFAEHDLPLEGPPCARLLCLRAALGIAPAYDDTRAAWMQVGLSSTLDPNTYQRPSLTLVMAVDVSGSMGWEYPGEDQGVTPGALARSLLHELGGRLGEGDRVAVVTYGSKVAVPLPLTSAAEQDVYHQVIDQLATAGSTNMEAGLERAYQIAAAAMEDGATKEVRVVLFTDVRPNVGASTASQFDRIVAEGSESGAGLTVFGLGLGLGQTVLTAIADVRGGNAFSLFQPADVGRLMEDSWPWLAAPIAYDLELALNPGPGFELARAYGFPGHGPGEARLQVSTVFLSKRRGGLLLRLHGLDMTALRAGGLLRYRDGSGAVVDDAVGAIHSGEPLDARGQFFQQRGVAKATALAMMVEGMRAATGSYRPERDRALALMRKVEQRMRDDAAALGDAALEIEVEFARALRALMEEGAVQQDPYQGL